MGGTVTPTVEKRSKISEFFNNLFKTKLETDTEKLAQRLQTNSGKVSGLYPWHYARSGLERQVLEKCHKADPRLIQLSGLSAEISCDLPKSLWQKFEADGQFLNQLSETVNGLSDRLIKEWAMRVDVNERNAQEAHAKNDQKAVTAAQKQFEKEAAQLQKEWEDVAVETVQGFFEAKAEMFGDRKRYVFKTVAKLTATIGGIIISIAALSTAATPAAPATLVPALIGLVSATGSMAKQIVTISASAEMIQGKIGTQLASMQGQWKDENGKWRKKTFKAREFGTALASSLTGGYTDLYIPSIDALKSDTDTLKGKTDGLEVTLHEMSVAINGTVDALVQVDKVLEDNKAFLQDVIQKGDPKKQAAKLMKKIEKSLADFETMRQKFEEDFDAVPEMAERIKGLRESNEQFRTALEEAEKALGTKNIALITGIVVSLANIGASFASPPTDLAEKVTAGLGTAWAAIDGLREFGPGVIEGVGTT